MEEQLSVNPVDDICSVGEVINGRYVVLSLIGKGGMGAVYKVRDTVLEEELALKILLPHFETDAMIIERFMNEVRITRKIAHPNIVRVHDIGVMGNGLFISMEYVDGESLRAILDRRGVGARLSVRQAVYIITQLCIALKYAHRYTIHRDIKPENIMVTRKNHIKLMDFGIAKLEDERFNTNPDAIVGTPRYMAPEQLHHAPDVDGRADIYSMGVVLYELVMGKLPSVTLEPISHEYEDIPPELGHIIGKCLEPDRDKRYQSPGELREALRALSNSLHDASEPGFTPAQNMTPDVLTPVPSLANVAGALEAFLKEETSAEQALENASRTHAHFPAPNTSDTNTYPDLAIGDTTPLEGKFAEQHSEIKSLPPLKRTDNRRTVPFHIIIPATVLGILLLLLGMAYINRTDKEPVVQQTQDVETGFKQIHTILNSSTSLEDALKMSLLECKRANTIENQEIAATIRHMFIQDVKNRLYSNPFDSKKLNSASRDAVQAGQFDSDESIRQLTELVNHEVAQFKFVLVHINTETKSATFRLNNPYSSIEAENVTTGDLLQGRFRVLNVGAQSVSFEDTDPKCARRSLVARIMEPVAAE